MLENDCMMGPVLIEPSYVALFETDGSVCGRTVDKSLNNSASVPLNKQKQLPLYHENKLYYPEIMRQLTCFHYKMSFAFSLGFCSSVMSTKALLISLRSTCFC